MRRREFLGGTAALPAAAKAGWLVPFAHAQLPIIVPPGREPTSAGPNHWWSNWPATFGYVCPTIYYPQSLSEISDVIKGITNSNQSLKAVGAGWSFTDASLPFRDQTEVNAVSILLRGKSATRNLSGILQGLNGATQSPMDLVPEALDNQLASVQVYDQQSTTFTVPGNGASGTGLTPVNTTAQNVALISIQGLASSLQQTLPSILSSAAQKSNNNYFHVEAGITMADLQQLLDHQKPRLAVQATGGNPLSTLAESLSTATHGGEFQWPLLIDRVRVADLLNTPLNTPLRTGSALTKLQAFKAVRQMFINGSLPIFNNNFTSRLGL